MMLGLHYSVALQTYGLGVRNLHGLPLLIRPRVYQFKSSVLLLDKQIRLAERLIF
jgi:hypothetical protein